MPEALLTSVVVTQSVVAGFVAALCILQWVWWRSDRGRSGSGWLLAWTAALAVLFLVNTPLSVLPPGPAADVVMFVRAQVLAVCLLLAMPTVRAFTGGPPTGPFVLAAAIGFAVRAVVWLTTDLILVGAGTELPVARGPLAVPLFLVPLAAVCGYVVAGAARCGGAARPRAHRLVERGLGRAAARAVPRAGRARGPTR